MEAERLRSVLEVVQHDFKEYNVGKRLEQVVNALKQSIDNPGEAQHGQSFRTALDGLRTTLAKSATNSLSQSKQQILESIEGQDLTGNDLWARVESILQLQDLTPSLAHQQLVELQNELNQFNTTVNNAVGVLDKLNIAAEELPEGSYEVGIVIPDSAMDGTLRGLSKETKFFDQLLSALTELVEGSREPPKIRSLGSGSVEVFLLEHAATALVLAKTVSVVLDIILKALEIQKKRQELQQMKMPREIIQDVEKHEKELTKNELKNYHKELISAHGKRVPKPRLNELSNELSQLLKGLAKRLYRGTTLEITHNVPAPTEDEEGEPKDDQKRWEEANGASEAITKRNLTLKKFPLSERPALPFEESEEDTGDGSEQKPSENAEDGK